PHGHVYPDFCHRPHGRLDRPRAGTTGRQPPLPPAERIRRPSRRQEGGPARRAEVVLRVLLKARASAKRLAISVARPPPPEYNAVPAFDFLSFFDSSQP